MCRIGMNTASRVNTKVQDIQIAKVPLIKVPSLLCAEKNIVSKQTCYGHELCAEQYEQNTIAFSYMCILLNSVLKLY